LLGNGITHRFLPKPLIGVEFQQHPASSLDQLMCCENTILLIAQ
jgi:hypothetical protein